MESNESTNLYRRVIRTLRRIPKDIRLELATHEFDMEDGSYCLIGTAVRAGLARAQGLATEDVLNAATSNGAGVYISETENAARLFGGKEENWNEIFQGVVDYNYKFPIIERAFTNSLLEVI